LSDFPLRVCFETIEHVADPHALLRTLAADLPPNGVAVVSTPNGESGQSANPHHFREYGSAEFRGMLEQHFRSVRMFFQWHFPDPLEAGLTVGNVLRALVPVKIKHRLKGPGAAPEPARQAFIPIGLAADCRPLPQRYLTLLPPGFRYTPSLWVAVCS
jgi:hypothetical protein